MKYLQIYPDEIKALTERLDDAERGRLFMAMIEYTETGEEPDLPGNENFVWPQARLHLDKQREAYFEKVAGAERAREAREQAKKNEQKGNFCSQKKNSDSRNSNSDPRKKTLEPREEQEQEHKQEQKGTERSKNSNNNINNNNKESEIIIIIINALKDCLGREITEAEKKLLEEWVSKYGADMVSGKIKAMTLCAKDKTLSYLKASLENEANGVKKGKHGPETPEEKEKRERAEEIKAWERRQIEYLDLCEKKNEVCQEACP